jgi:hypothetical protein
MSCAVSCFYKARTHANCHSTCYAGIDMCAFVVLGQAKPSIAAFLSMSAFCR